jgi:hypothetical protein
VVSQWRSFPQKSRSSRLRIDRKEPMSESYYDDRTKADTIQKLYQVMSSLVSGEGEIKGRLVSAGLTLVTKILGPKEFPPELREEYEAIHRDLTSKAPVGIEGSLNATIQSLTPQEASQLAERVFSLYRRMLHRSVR